MDQREVVCQEFCERCYEEYAFCQCDVPLGEYVFLDEFDDDRDYELDPEPHNLPRDPLLGDEPVKTKKKTPKATV